MNKSNPFAFDSSGVSNYQRAIVRFRRETDLIPIGAFLANMEIVADDRVGTASTDCVTKITYSPKYFDSLSVDQCVSALIHEVNHKFLNFFPRFERWCVKHEATHSRRELLRIFNVAQDYFINYMIKHDWKLPLGDGWLYDPKYRPETMSTEQIADDLIKQGFKPPHGKQSPQDASGGSKSDDDNGSGNPDDDGTGDEGDDTSGDDSGQPGGDSGQPGDDADDADDADNESGTSGSGDDTATGDGDADPTGDVGEGDDIELPPQYNGDINNRLTEEDLREIETQNRQDISQSTRAARGYGVGDGNDPFSANAADAAYSATFDFESELKKWANDSAKHGPYTWQRQHRKRRTAQGFVFPTRRGKEIGTAVFCIDSSGSTDGPMVRYFLDEVTEALKTVNYKRAVIIWCSDAVAKVQEFTKQEADSKHSLFDGRIYRSGYGTNFPPAFEHIAEHYPDARCVTYLTDGGVGEYDVEECAKIVKQQLHNVPVLWAIADEYEWGYVKRFRDWTRKHGIGRCVNLPMDKVKERAA